MKTLIPPLLTTVLLLAGCATPVAEEPVPVTAPPLELPVHSYAGGSIYSAAHSVALFEDLRARRIGDVVTVILTERTDASKTATTSTSKETGFEIGAGTLFEQDFDGSTLDTTKEFEGTGNSVQNNRLSGSLTVTVVDVLSNGLLLVRGGKEIAINQGREMLYVQGLVRPVDVRRDNTVLSTQIANAYLTYTGKGALADANQEGWLTRFFGSVLSPL